MEYVVDDPLSTVFTEQAMGKYLRVFNFLWRLKRVEHSLCATWQTMKPNVAAALQRRSRGSRRRGALGRAPEVSHAARRDAPLHRQLAVLRHVRGAGGILGALLARDGGGVGPGLAHPRARAVPRHHPPEGPLGPKSQLLTNTLGTLFEVILRFRGLRTGCVVRRGEGRGEAGSSRSSGWSSARGGERGGSPRGRTRCGDGLLSEESWTRCAAARRNLRGPRQDAGRVPEPAAAADARGPEVLLLFRLTSREYYQRR